MKKIHLFLYILLIMIPITNAGDWVRQPEIKNSTINYNTYNSYNTTLGVQNGTDFHAPYINVSVLNVTAGINAGDWSNVTITESQITDLLHTTNLNGSDVSFASIGGTSLNVTDFILADDWTNVTITESQISDLTHTTNLNGSDANFGYVNMNKLNITGNLYAVDGNFSGDVKITNDLWARDGFFSRNMEVGLDLDVLDDAIIRDDFAVYGIGDFYGNFYAHDTATFNETIILKRAGDAILKIETTSVDGSSELRMLADGTNDLYIYTYSSEHGGSYYGLTKNSSSYVDARGDRLIIGTFDTSPLYLATSQNPRIWITEDGDVLPYDDDDITFGNASQRLGDIYVVGEETQGIHFVEDDGSYGNLSMDDDFNLLWNGNIINASRIESGGGNSSAWSRSGTSVFLTNTGDNVGIGVANPAYKLTVDGNVNVSGTDNLMSLGWGNLTGVPSFAGDDDVTNNYTASIGYADTRITNNKTEILTDLRGDIDKNVTKLDSAIIGNITKHITDDKHGNTTTEIRQQFLNSSNISIIDGVIAINESFSQGAHTVDTDTWRIGNHTDAYLSLINGTADALTLGWGNLTGVPAFAGDNDVTNNYTASIGYADTRITNNVTGLNADIINNYTASTSYADTHISSNVSDFLTNGSDAHFGNINASSLNVTGISLFNDNVNMGENNITNINRIYLINNSYIGYGHNATISGVDNSLVFYNDLDIPGGEVSHAFIEGSKVVRTWQVGLPFAAGYMRNSQIIGEDFNDTNATMIGSCNSYIDTFNEKTNKTVTLKVDCFSDTYTSSGTGADLIVEDDIQLLDGTLFAEYGFEGKNYFLFDGIGKPAFFIDSDIIVEKNRIENVTFGVGEFNDVEDFLGGLGTYTSTTWDEILDTTYCNTDDICVESRAGDNDEMNRTFNLINNTDINISFYYGVINFDSTDNLSFVIHNGSEEIPVWNYSGLSNTDVPSTKKFINIDPTLWNKSLTFIFRCKTTNPSEACFIDDVNLTSFDSVTQTQETGRMDGTIYFGNKDCYIGMKDGVKKNITISCDDIILLGNVTETFVTIANENVTGDISAGSFTLDGESLVNWDNITNFVKVGNTTAEIAGVKVNNATYSDDTSKLDGQIGSYYLDDTTINQNGTDIKVKGLNATFINTSEILSGDWTNVTITESQISDLVHTVDTWRIANHTDADLSLINGTAVGIDLGCGNITGATSDLCTLTAGTGLTNDTDARLNNLTVVGVINISAEEDPTYGQLIIQDKETGVNAEAWMSFLAGTSIVGWIGDKSNTGIDFYVSATQNDLCLGDDSDSCVIKLDAGKVGIKDTTPSYTLDVNGNLRSTSNDNVIPLGWGNLTSIPAGFADGIDADTTLNGSDATLKDVNMSDLNITNDFTTNHKFNITAADGNFETGGNATIAKANIYYNGSCTILNGTTSWLAIC